MERLSTSGKSSVNGGSQYSADSQLPTKDFLALSEGQTLEQAFGYILQTQNKIYDTLQEHYKSLQTSHETLKKDFTAFKEARGIELRTSEFKLEKLTQENEADSERKEEENRKLGKELSLLRETLSRSERERLEFEAVVQSLREKNETFPETLHILQDVISNLHGELEWARRDIEEKSKNISNLEVAQQSWQNWKSCHEIHQTYINTLIAANLEAKKEAEDAKRKSEEAVEEAARVEAARVKAETEKAILQAALQAKAGIHTQQPLMPTSNSVDCNRAPEVVAAVMQGANQIGDKNTTDERQSSKAKRFKAVDGIITLRRSKRGKVIKPQPRVFFLQ